MTTLEPTELSKKMRALAETGHPRADELVEKADAFDQATHGFYADEQTVSVKEFLGCYTRACWLWCDITEESSV